MKNQLQGIGMMLFGIVCMLFSIIDPWIPMIDDASILVPWIGLACGIIGLVFLFKKENE